MEELIKAVRQHALENYEKGGWDILVECYEDKEIEELIGDAKTPEQAIKRVGKSLKIQDDHRKDIESTAF